MRRIRFLSLALAIILVVAGLVAPVVLAKKGGGGGGNPHLLDKTLRWSRGSVELQGAAAGIGESVTVRLDAWGQGTAYCKNKGGNEAPGQNPVDVHVAAWDEFRADKGRADFWLVAEATVTWKEAGCPNGNWRVTRLSVDWRYVKTSLRDGATVEYCFKFTPGSGPTDPPDPVSCSPPFPQD